MTFQDHIERLAARSESDRAIAIEYVATSKADCRAYLAEQAVDIMPVTDDVSYAMALHELGHLRCYRSRTSYRGEGYLLPSECYAWQWAVENARSWSVAMHDTLIDCLASYAQMPGSKPHRDLYKQTLELSALRLEQG